MRNPIRDPFTVPYGAAFGAVRAGGARTHQGLDEHCPEGTPIFAGERGTVVGWGYTSGYGNYIDITYPGRVHVRYAHMQYPASLSNGQSWTTGEPQLGLVGKTGSAAYGDPPGAHLHVEVRVYGNLVDPAKFFTQAAPAGDAGTEIGDDMPLDKADHDWLNGLGQSIIEQILGIAAYKENAGTVASVKKDINYISNVQPHSLKAIHAAVTKAGTVTPGATVDLGPILAAIKALPGETVAAIKQAL